MCGIACFVGKNAPQNCYNAIEKLEYRGYDSAGIALLSGDIKVYKKVGGVKEIKDFCFSQDSFFAIAHTRWATHGEVSELNAHPHLSFDGSLAIVHNGIIENFEYLKHWLKERGIECHSQTDTEVIVNVISVLPGTLEEKVAGFEKMATGSYAIAVLDKQGKIALAKRGCPLYLSVGQGYCAASDTSCFSSNEYYPLKDDEIAILTKDNIELYGINLTRRDIEFLPLDKSSAYTGLDGFNHFMQKEISEVGDVIKKIKATYEDRKIFKRIEKFFLNIDNIMLIGCGTAYHAGQMGAIFLEETLKIPCNAYVASEFKYSNKVIKNTLGIFISQSGETADTLGCLKIFKEAGAKTIAIVSNMQSSLARQADEVLSACSGIEVAVASTKAYVAQILVLFALSRQLGGQSIAELSKLSSLAKKGTAISEEVIRKVISARKVFFIGRGQDSVTASEAALKLKEVTYMNAEGYPAGELKHGTIALIDGQTVVVVFATSEALYDKTISSLKEARARGAEIIFVSPFASPGDYQVKLPLLKDEKLLSVLAILPFQTLAYEIAVRLNLNPDKPRNLAKSVTVE